MNFESVYRTNYDFIWRTLRRLGVHERHAEDACQTVLLTAFRRLADFEGRSSIKTWLCGIALRVASDYRRSAVMRHECLVEPAHGEPMAPDDPQAELELRERLAELDLILSRLALDQRTVLVLHDFEQFSGEEISQLVGVPLGTVKSRLRLARQAFSRILAQRHGTAPRLAAGSEP